MLGNTLLRGVAALPIRTHKRRRQTGAAYQRLFDAKQRVCIQRSASYQRLNRFARTEYGVSGVC